MLICNNGHVFDESEAESRFDRVGERYGDGYYITICPHCHEDEITEAEMCERCGNYTFEDEIVDGICSDCREDILGRFEELNSEFTELERDFITENFDFDEWILKGRD